MSGMGTGATLLAEIFPGRAESAGVILEGWAPPEVTHRWTVGGESRCRLPVASLGPDCVLVVDIKPYCDDDCPTQTIMLAIDDRLIGTIQISDQRALGFRVPAGIVGEDTHVLGFTHLNSRGPRAKAGLDHHGLPLGAMVMSLRLYRLAAPHSAAKMLPALPGTIASGDFAHVATRLTSLSLPGLASHFECLGHNCEIGIVQRAFGAEPLGLLRFAGVVAHRVVEGLRQGFSGIGNAETTSVFVKNDPEPEFKVYEQTYYLWYSTRRSPHETTLEAMHAEQCKRFIFLQRKFKEDMELGEKIFAFTRNEVMTEAEALALFCALNLHARNTLLWTLPGDKALAGRVEQIMPGFLLGHLGDVDPVHEYASHEAWLSVMVNAWRMQKEAVLF
jgi:hypothetical protein